MANTDRARQIAELHIQAANHWDAAADEAEARGDTATATRNRTYADQNRQLAHTA